MILLDSSSQSQRLVCDSSKFTVKNGRVGLCLPIRFERHWLEGEDMRASVLMLRLRSIRRDGSLRSRREFCYTRCQMRTQMNNGWNGTVAATEGIDLQGREMLHKPTQVGGRGTPPAVNGLIAVAHHPEFLVVFTCGQEQ